MMALRLDVVAASVQFTGNGQQSLPASAIRFLMRLVGVEHPAPEWRAGVDDTTILSVQEMTGVALTPLRDQRRDLVGHSILEDSGAG